MQQKEWKETMTKKNGSCGTADASNLHVPSWQPGEDYGLVSIVMPNYNGGRFLKESIQSVISQTYSNWELLFVDDCSTDDSLELVRSFRDERIRIFQNETNSGAAVSRNYALRIAKGKWIAFLDSDDLWLPEKLEKQICLLDKNDAGLCYTSYCVVNLERESFRKDYIVPEFVTTEDLLKQNYIGCSTVMLTAEVAHKYRFTSDFFHEDYVCWLTMLRDGISAVGVKDVLMDYSYYASSKSGNKLSTYKYRWRIYRRHMGCSVFRSFGYLVHNTLAGIRKYLF